MHRYTCIYTTSTLKAKPESLQTTAEMTRRARTPAVALHLWRPPVEADLNMTISLSFQFTTVFSNILCKCSGSRCKYQDLNLIFNFA